jgi:acyl-CoA thioesterase-1
MTMIGRIRTGYRQVWLLGPLVACSAPAPAPEATINDTPPPAAAPTNPAVDTRPVVLFVGTSLTAGLGLDPAQAYPALIQQRVDSAGLDLRVVNAGVSGETSAGALRRIGWLLGQGAPAVVVVETGANDGLRGQPIDSLRANATLLPFLLDGVAGVDSLNQPDGIHPNPAGARRVAENVWRALAPKLTAPP